MNEQQESLAGPLQFLADESCDFALVRALRSSGYNVAAVSELARGAPDNAVIALAIEKRRILLTEDKDFGRLVFAAGHATGGVILVRFPGNQREAMTERVLYLVQQEGPRLARAFVVVQASRTRIIDIPA